MGTKTEALPEQEGALDTKRIRFAKDRKPKMREGHILILFATGSQKLITYLSAMSNVQHDPDNEQYPWFVNTKDWAPEYSKRWWTFDNILGTLAAEHLASNPANKLSATKPMDAASFATSIYGKSNLELNTDFAYSLINKMKAR
ncbi:MAG: hypothetical protein A2268_13390 [Candidatus Raymondbacteria bacterium RifOxyA12_full_50_37]|uniref:Uncharacterized protein n=1 Tax=Candidatus Raymondbacteria bacterium RIFOXYD12_FULL_49_13 TaxID=1817890 RepID=A0A1F7F093_UNCRA|nr:MAG: hypothetical protein A2268_13390 [Candidatus Raymondbacteria bacterium RifOxyA12_full_50_37]OGJ93054.1 MAG: hypothetical protein A2248_18525 [Candidatus Raymondbacteria bacterium RIFOXYA2_FULL_49_16]OGJ94886.1 MAG: hypothetical protein A2350_15575 [Candidatus Raymondbacteria bacterium RifOxyB12_full_50_8]OGJ99966.1 MAG: hypothetical protein A2519_00505 [Candidatus Raymondbacteria bacterium RIFOXYD12_FULL_49_13]OGK04157.1 MAG: hypothetical protein A2487_14185 [Candidatus Raymondbacteria 